MPITKTTVTGPLLDTSGEAYTNVTLRITPARAFGDEGSGATLAQSPVDVVPDDVTGAFSVDLAPSIEVAYRAAVVVKLPYAEREYQVGFFYVPESGPVSLQSLLDEYSPPIPSPAPTMADLNAAVQSAQSSAGSASDSAAAANQDRIQTGQDAIATAADRVQTGLDREATSAALPVIDGGIGALAVVIGQVVKQVNGGRASLAGGSLSDPALRVGEVSIYSATPDTLSVAVAGVERLRVTSSGMTVYGTVTESP